MWISGCCWAKRGCRCKCFRGGITLGHGDYNLTLNETIANHNEDAKGIIDILQPKAESGSIYQITGIIVSIFENLKKQRVPLA